MQPEIDPNTFTQKDLIQHLLHTAQHAVTREEMAAQFAQAEQLTKERFEHVDKRFKQAEQYNKDRFNSPTTEIKDQGKKHGCPTWALFAVMTAVFFKDIIVSFFTTPL